MNHNPANITKVSATAHYRRKRAVVADRVPSAPVLRFQVKAWLWLSDVCGALLIELQPTMLCLWYGILQRKSTISAL